MLMRYALAPLLVAYVPGALMFRLPVGAHARRAALSAEERVFWYLLLSLLLSSCTTLALAAAGWYRVDRLLWTNGAISVLILGLARGRLRLRSSAPGPTWSALIPLGLLVAGVCLNFLALPAEYVMGGRDPGVYFNAGIQIAQRGSLVIDDEAVRVLPPRFRGLFFPPRADPRDYSNRFMGFFVLDPARGTVVGQFPPLYPVWIAIAYGINGLSGARAIVGIWAVVGLLAVYFLGARLMGRAAAAAGAGLLALHVIQVWYARYPNAEIVMQALVFTSLLAYTRAHVDRDRFFAPVAALLLVLGVFAHLTGVLAAAAVATAAVLAAGDDDRVRLGFWLPLAIGICVAAAYLASYIPPYFNVPVGFIQNLRPFHLVLIALAAIAGAGFLLGRRRARVGVLVRTVPVILTAAVWALAVYALFIRTAGGALAAHDADSLRAFTSFYLSPYGLAAALIGFALVARSFSTASAFLLTLALFSFFFFYKIRIVPEHFWAARRFLAVILPGALLLVGAAAFLDVRPAPGGRLVRLYGPRLRAARYAAGLVLVLLLGRHFLNATLPILRHVEYAGLIARLERLAATFGEDDLVLVESRGASDVHVLALPLAYIYARNVLVLATTNPDKQLFREFVSWARTRYRRVFFVGGGGTELLSRRMTVVIIGGERFQVPEYQTAWNAYPRGVRLKEFDLGVYEFLPQPADAEGFDLTVGLADDLYVRRFHAKERHSSGATFRWTRDISYMSIVGIDPAHRFLTLWMGNGGRPSAAAGAEVKVFLNDVALGEATVGPGVRPYPFAIPQALASAVARSEDAAQVRLVTRTWNPARLLGGGDDRDLGVMLERVEVR